MSRAELNPQHFGSGAVAATAKLLLFLNAVLLIGSYFALPAYQKMHAGEISNAEFLVFELLAAVDIAAASLVLKGWWRWGICLIALTSTVWCVGSIAMQMSSGAQLSVFSVLGTASVGYWDVALLGMLMRRASRLEFP